jgi:hypothetical protein
MATNSPRDRCNEDESSASLRAEDAGSIPSATHAREGRRAHEYSSAIRKSGECLESTGQGTSVVTQQTFDDALALVADLHLEQARKATDIPYVSHLLVVASIALEYGAGESVAIAALLHDAIEGAARKL